MDFFAGIDGLVGPFVMAFMLIAYFVVLAHMLFERVAMFLGMLFRNEDPREWDYLLNGPSISTPITFVTYWALWILVAWILFKNHSWLFSDPLARALSSIFDSFFEGLF